MDIRLLLSDHQLPESSGFVPVDFSSALDVETYLGEVPEGITCKGLFFSDVIDAAEPIASRLDAPTRELLMKRHVSFMDYPLVEHMRLTAGVVPQLFPNLPIREGMRRLGWVAFPAFARSTVGRLVLGLMKVDADKALDIAPRSIELSMSRGRAVTRRIGRNHTEIDFVDIYGYLDSYYVGVVEGALRFYGAAPRVRTKLVSRSKGTFEVRW